MNPSSSGKFGIELEFFLLGQDGAPALGSTAQVIRRFRERDLPNVPVPELGSFQIEQNPGPWPLTPEGVERGIDELARGFQHLKECAFDLGLSVSTAPIIPRIDPSQLADPRLLTDNARSRATSSYFAKGGAVAEFEDGTSLRFPGETILACLNEIHIHVQLSSDEATLQLFNALNASAEEIVRPFQSPITLNGKRLRASCTTMKLFADSDGEPNKDGTLRRVGSLPGPIRSAEEYARAVSSFTPIPCAELDPPYLALESSVWFWTRLRGAPGDLRVEFRPMDMGDDWRDRVRYLTETARRLSREQESLLPHHVTPEDHR